MGMSGRPTPGVLDQRPNRLTVTPSAGLPYPARKRSVLSRVLLCIFLATVISRMGWILYTGAYCAALDGEAEFAARNLARAGSFANIHGDNSGPTAHLSPLYPLFLAGIFRLFGAGTPAANLIKCGFAVLAVAVAYAALPLLAGRARLSRSAGLAAAILGAMPLRCYAETEANWEQPCVTAVLVGLAWCFVWLHDRAWRAGPAAVTGILCGAAALFSGVLALPPALFALGEFCSRPGLRPRIARSSLVLLACGLMILSPWIVRNFLVFGRFIPLRSNAGLELRIGNNPAADGRTFGPDLWPQLDTDARGPFRPYHPQNNPAQRQRLEKMGEPAFMDEMARAAREWIAANPTRFVVLCLRRFRLFWLPSMDGWFPGTPFALARSVFMDAVGLFTLLGLGTMVVSKHPYRWCFLATAFGLCLPYLITHVSTRYTLPVYPLSLLLACEFLAVVGRWLITQVNRAKDAWPLPARSARQDSDDIPCMPSAPIGDSGAHTAKSQDASSPGSGMRLAPGRLRV
jgi:hypothetical protein